MKNRTRTKKYFHSRIAVRLWGLMMLLVLLVVGFMWIVQIVFLEQNYVNSSINNVQAQLDPVMEDLKITDLAYNEDMIAYLSQVANGKMLLVGNDGELEAMYSYGHPIDLEHDFAEIGIWEGIRYGEEYDDVSSGGTFNKVIYQGNRALAYEIGIPVHYHGQEAYLILYHSFAELYTVLDMNRNMLIVLTIGLTIVAAIMAILLSRRFTHPIKVITQTVNRMAEGDLQATPGITLQDELGELSHSVEQLGQELQRVDVLRKEVIANVSHELRTPLSLIGGYAEMVRDITWRKDKEREENLNLIVSEARRMTEMVNDILSYSQLQSGYLELKKEEYNLYDIVEAEVAHCQVAAEENHVKIVLHAVTQDMPVQADALKMTQVIRNLLYNAINHTADEETIEILMTQEKELYKVAVINPGDPIPEEDREIIWERYQRSQHQGGRRQGTGIGLSIVSTILKAHDMSYGVECGDSRTEFWFTCLRK